MTDKKWICETCNVAHSTDFAYVPCPLQEPLEQNTSIGYKFVDPNPEEQHPWGPGIRQIWSEDGKFTAWDTTGGKWLEGMGLPKETWKDCQHEPCYAYATKTIDNKNYCPIHAKRLETK